MTRVAAVWSACVLATLTLASAQSLETLPVGPFSLFQVGGPPAGWQSVQFRDVAEETQYSLSEENGRVVLRADSRTAASALVKRVAVDAADYPYLTWSWKTGANCFTGDWQHPAVDDFPLRLFVLFEHSGGMFSFLKKKMGPTFSGDAILYVTRSGSGTADEDRVSHVGPRIRVIPLRPASADTDGWVPVVRNIRADYLALFDREPGEVTAVAVMTDTDNTETECVSYFGDISLSANSSTRGIR